MTVSDELDEGDSYGSEEDYSREDDLFNDEPLVREQSQEMNAY